MRSIRRTEAQCAYRSAISPKDIKFYRRAGGSGAFVEPKRSALTLEYALQSDYS